MRRSQCLGDLDADVERLLDRERAPRNPLRQRLAFQELHDEEQPAANAGREFTDVVERADVRMLELRDVARFAFESLAPRGIVSQRRRHHLDRHGAIEARIRGSIDLPHAALADQAKDFVGAEPCPGGQHWRIGRTTSATR